MNSRIPSGDSRLPGQLEDLFVRYWDNSLDNAALTELETRIVASPKERDRFNELCLQAAIVADRLATTRLDNSLKNTYRRSRSSWCWAVMTACAALVALALGGLYLTQPASAPSDSDRTAILVRSTGVVRIWGMASGEAGTEGASIRPGRTVTTHGINSSVLLVYPDGTAVTLSGDTEVTLMDNPGKRLYVRQGNLSADVRPQPRDAPLIIATPEAEVEVVGTVLSVGRTPRRTEVGVQEGRARVSRPQGAPLLEVSGGERGVVEADGAVRKDRMARTPDTYRWRTDRPLPAEWGVGCILDDPTAEPTGRVIAPALFDDPYIHRRCWQIRSENGWVPGLFLVHEDSRFRVRYRVDRPGRGQLLIVVRPNLLTPKPRHTHVLLAPLVFEPPPEGRWHTVELTTADWFPERETPDYPFPWVSFLVVFNTYEEDLGLRVAEFTVSRPALPKPTP